MDNNLVISKEDMIKNYGKIYEVNATIEPEGEDSQITKTFYFIKPKTPSFNRYIKKVSVDTIEASNVFVKDNIIIEQQDELSEFIEEYPAAVMSLSEKLLYMVGLAKEINFKKL